MKKALSVLGKVILALMIFAACAYLSCQIIAVTWEWDVAVDAVNYLNDVYIIPLIGDSFMALGDFTLLTIAFLASYAIVVSALMLWDRIDWPEIKWRTRKFARRIRQKF